MKPACVHYGACTMLSLVRPGGCVSSCQACVRHSMHMLHMYHRHGQLVADREHDRTMQLCVAAIRVHTIYAFCQLYHVTLSYVHRDPVKLCMSSFVSRRRPTANLSTYCR
jgi:hypothetical protein